MSSVPKNGSDRVEYWEKVWDKNDIGFHQSAVHTQLIKHFGRLTNDGSAKKIFVPLCGKTLDMKWLLDQGIEVVGVDGVKAPLEQFCSEHKITFDKKSVSGVGPNASVLKSSDGKLRLYCCDMMNFSTSLEGTYEAVWDRGSLVAISRDDVPTYVDIMKKLLSPGGRILVEVMEYDLSMWDDMEGFTKPPPPHAMFEDELKKLFEPDFDVEFLERNGRKLKARDIIVAVYLLKKKPA